jgi:hypothetical protein
MLKSFYLPYLPEAVIFLNQIKVCWKKCEAARRPQSKGFSPGKDRKALK